MATVKFNLISKSSEDSIKESNLLIDVFRHIRTHVNEPRNWMVEELEDDEAVNQCCAYYLVENFTEDSLPQTISDIN